MICEIIIYCEALGIEYATFACITIVIGDVFPCSHYFIPYGTFSKIYSSKYSQWLPPAVLSSPRQHSGMWRIPVFL